MNELFRAFNHTSYKTKNKRYTVYTDPTEYIINNKRNINFMWDTGAFISVLSVSNFVKDIESIEYKNLVNTIEYDTEQIDYHAVSGGGKGVLRKINHLKIKNLYLNSFYFLLVKDVIRIINNKIIPAGISLLGADFIDFCKFEHEINSDIIIHNFDYESYATYHKQYRIQQNTLNFHDLFHINPTTSQNNTSTTTQLHP